MNDFQGDALFVYDWTIHFVRISVFQPPDFNSSCKAMWIELGIIQYSHCVGSQGVVSLPSRFSFCSVPEMAGGQSATGLPCL